MSQTTGRVPKAVPGLKGPERGRPPYRIVTGLGTTPDGLTGLTPPS
ncbi:hypothetical protein [Microbulbifer sp. S227A]